VSEITLQDIEEARTRSEGTYRQTPMIRKDALDVKLGVHAYLKAEHLQRTGSFKIRGAMNLMAQLSDAEKAMGVVAASAGNHAQGVAIAAREFGVKARIFMPIDATLSKLEATRNYGAEVELVGDSFDDALRAEREHAETSGALFVHPFDDPRIIAGQGTCGLEIVEQVPDVGTIVVPIGGGGLMSGVALAVKALKPDVRIVGVQSSACASFAESLRQGTPTTIQAEPTIADGIAVKQVGALTYSIMQKLVDDVVVVEDNHIATSMLWLIERGKQVVEPAGAAALAAVHDGLVDPQGKPIVIVLSGGNIDPMQLIAVIRHGLSAAGRFVSFSTFMPDRPGELSRLLVMLAELRVNIRSIEHHREGADVGVADTRVDLTLQTQNRVHADEVLGRLRESGYVLRLK
jgi:threonine dehydratase